MICRSFPALLATVALSTACERRVEVGRDLVFDVPQELSLDAGAAPFVRELDAGFEDGSNQGEQGQFDEEEDVESDSDEDDEFEDEEDSDDEDGIDND